MTLQITPSEIQIKNTAGDVLVSTSDKLVYKVRRFTQNNISILNTPITFPFTPPTIDEFLIARVKIISSEANLGQLYVGKELGFNAPLVLAQYVDVYENLHVEFISLGFFDTYLSIHPTDYATGAGSWPVTHTTVFNLTIDGYSSL